MTAQPLSPTEAATVARFDAAQPAPESWGHPHHWIGTHDHGPVCAVCGMRKPEGGDDELRAALADWLNHAPLLDVDDLLALPEIAALRAKAAAADRVRELADTYAFLGATLHDVPRAQTWAEAATELRTALDGPT